MNNITINIENYLTKEEIKAIITDAIRSTIYNMYKGNQSNLDRLISNLSYEIIFNAISDIIGQDVKTVLTEKVHNLLKEDETIRYQIWRKKDAWDRSESPAISILYDAIKQNAPLIEDKVIESIQEYKFNEIQDAMYEALEQILYDKVFGKKEN